MLQSVTSDQVRLTQKDKDNIEKIIGHLPNHIKTKKQLTDYINAQKTAYPESIAETKLLRRLLENYLI